MAASWNRIAVRLQQIDGLRGASLALAGARANAVQ